MTVPYREYNRTDDDPVNGASGYSPFGCSGKRRVNVLLPLNKQTALSDLLSHSLLSVFFLSHPLRYLLQYLVLHDPCPDAEAKQDEEEKALTVRHRLQKEPS